MKKLFFFAAIAAAALSSCSSDELVQAEQPVVEDGAVSFSAYTGRANRATEMKDAELGEYGFGVFAYEQGNTAWDTYRAGNTYPNFMYNQKVGKTVDTPSEYSYDNTKKITKLAGYVNASAYIKSLYTAPEVKATSEKFTTAQKDALVSTYSWTPGDFTEDSSDSGFWTYSTTGTAAKLSYAQYDALSGTLWANKAKLFELNESFPNLSDKLTPAAYNALPAADQDHFKYTDPVVSGDWEYHPVKYFSNNEDAKHSFFAYAPYQQEVKAVFSDNGPAIRYNATDDYDLLWGKNAATELAWYDTPKQAVTDNINLSFQHALSKVSFMATYFVDDVHDNHDEGVHFIDEDTKVVIRSVKFVGQVPSQGLLSLYDGTWKYEKIEESACEMMTGTTFIWDGNVDDANKYKPLKNNMMLIPTQAGDKVKIQIVYDVITTDVANPKNNSTVTNTITSKDSYELEQGKAYTFKLDLGLTSVKFNASVVNWDDEAGTNVDLPNNYKFPGVVAVAAEKIGAWTEAATDPSDPTDGQQYWKTGSGENKVYKFTAGSPGSWNVDTSVSGMYFHAVDDKWYKVDNGEGTAKTEMNLYYKADTDELYNNPAFTGTAVTLDASHVYFINGSLYVKE